jgi:hypothetical protein
MRTPNSVVRCVLFTALCSVGIFMLGCSVFVGRLIVLPEHTTDKGQRSFDDSARATAVEIGRGVAKRNGLAPEPEPYTRLGGEDYATISIYQDSGRIWLSLLMKDDGSEMVYVITDQGHGKETKVTADIRRDLILEVDERLPNSVVSFEHRKERGSLMGP